MQDRVFSLSDIPETPVIRMSTNIIALDAAYGLTIIKSQKGKPQITAGLPVGGISLWSGESGVGKTRVCIAIAAGMNALGYRILYIQAEVTPSQFKTWNMEGVVNPKNFLICDYTDFQEQIKAINFYKPHLVVVDSLNMIQGHQSSNVIRSLMTSYKEVMGLVGGHLIAISHLNKAGTVKGNNDVMYLCDIDCSLQRLAQFLTNEQKLAFSMVGRNAEAMFKIEFNKNRYGATNYDGCQTYVCFQHTADGVEYVTSNLDPGPAR